MDSQNWGVADIDVRREMAKSERLEARLREHNEVDWVSVAQVLDEAAASGYPYPLTEETVVDYIVQLHAQGKIRIGTSTTDTPGGFAPWEQPVPDLAARLRAALVPKNPRDPLEPLMITMIDFIDTSE